jgi:multidrug efflux pump subunit AcrA (membrane-fusion protein)
MLELVLDSRENVLMIPEAAVAKTNGKTIVYYQDENGLKVYKPVQIGLTAEGMTEIVSGLTEGECVIAG